MPSPFFRIDFWAPATFSIWSLRRASESVDKNLFLCAVGPSLTTLFLPTGPFRWAAAVDEFGIRLWNGGGSATGKSRSVDPNFPLFSVGRPSSLPIVSAGLLRLVAIGFGFGIGSWTGHGFEMDKPRSVDVSEKTKRRYFEWAILITIACNYEVIWITITKFTHFLL